MECDVLSSAGAPRSGRRPRRTLLGVALGALVMTASALGVVTLDPRVGGAATNTSDSAASTAATATTTTTTTTTAAPVAMVSATTPSAPVSDPVKLKRVMAIADESGWDWRAAGVVIHIAFHPDDCCHWGIYDSQDSTLWIGPTAFASATRLRYVVLHEVAHAWQWHSGHFSQVMADLGPWGLTGYESLEAGADCVATLWGARTDHYWACPSDAQELMARRLAGDWA